MNILNKYKIVTIKIKKNENTKNHHHHLPGGIPNIVFTRFGYNIQQSGALLAYRSVYHSRNHFRIYPGAIGS